MKQKQADLLIFKDAVSKSPLRDKVSQVLMHNLEKSQKRYDKLKQIVTNVISTPDYYKHAQSFLTSFQLDLVEKKPSYLESHKVMQQVNKWNERYSSNPGDLVQTPFGQEGHTRTSSSAMVKKRIASSSRERHWRDNQATNIHMFKGGAFKLVVRVMFY